MILQSYRNKMKIPKNQKQKSLSRQKSITFVIATTNPIRNSNVTDNSKFLLVLSFACNTHTILFDGLMFSSFSMFVLCSFHFFSLQSCQIIFRKTIIFHQIIEGIFEITTLLETFKVFKIFLSVCSQKRLKQIYSIYYCNKTK